MVKWRRFMGLAKFTSLPAAHGDPAGRLPASLGVALDRAPDLAPQVTSPESTLSRGRLNALMVLFGTVYFAQGLIEPTAGLLAQPMQSRMNAWAMPAATIGSWMFLLGMPWTLKPLFGLLTDFVPLLGCRRWTYLIAACATSSASFIAVYLSGFAPESIDRAFALLALATTGVAFADVVIDGLAVEEGQPAGITGKLQSVQWASTSIATIVAGSLGGYLAQSAQLRSGFLICAALASVTFVLALFLVSEQRNSATASITGLRQAGRELLAAARSPLVFAVGGFLFLWNFNPFSSTVQQLYLTNQLQISEQFYGHLVSVFYAAGVPACVLYWLFCRKVPLGVLVHLSIGLGVISTLAYWALAGKTSAVVVSALAGFAYILGVVIQLDLAARVVPTGSAATLFALFMALSNTGLSLGMYFGGHMYDRLTARFGSRHIAFDILVAVGALCTAGCWLLVPWLRRCGLKWN